jgi:predicted PurR-regulated permease PerM
VLSFLVFILLAVAFGYPLINSLTHLANALPSYVKNAQGGKGWIGHLMRHYHVESWVSKNSSKLISLAQGLSKPALALGKGAASVLLAMLTTFAFVILVLLEAPKMRRVILATLSPGRAARLSKISALVSRSATGYVLGNLLTSLVAGVIVFLTLALLSVPFAFLFGLWVALVDFLPTIGGAIAGIPTVLFALAYSLSAGIITLVVFLAYTQVENHVLNPVVMSRTVKLNPLTVFVAVLIGAEIGAWIGGLFGGFVGVLLAIPAAATVQVLIREFWSTSRPTRADFPRGVIDPDASTAAD